MKSPTRDKLLEVKNLQVSFLGIKTITALSGISFSIGKEKHWLWLEKPGAVNP